MNKYSVDRIENQFAVLEFGDDFIQIELKELPPGVKEGDVLMRDENGKLFIDEKATQQIKNELFELQNSLFSE